MQLYCANADATVENVSVQTSSYRAATSGAGGPAPVAKAGSIVLDPNEELSTPLAAVTFETPAVIDAKPGGEDDVVGYRQYPI